MPLKSAILACGFFEVFGIFSRIEMMYDLFSILPE
jgi:hypothetical protein